MQSAQAFAQALPKECIKGEGSLLDLGSGGGVPMLPILFWFPDLRATLVDARSKRTRFLVEAADILGFAERATIVTARIEDVRDDNCGHTAVTARSFGPPSATVEIASSLLKVGGIALISEPPNGRLWAANGLHRLGVVQRSASGASIAVFEKVRHGPPLRRWKHLVDRPSVVVRPRGA
ncbi:MAG: RsmG family class I SAM-dependent methyltransferase [Acidimicrobiia bacterium]